MRCIRTAVATGHIKLIDFGLAKPGISSTDRDTTCGTPLYMPPEIAKVVIADKRTKAVCDYGLEVCRN